MENGSDQKTDDTCQSYHEWLDWCDNADLQDGKGYFVCKLKDGHLHTTLGEMGPIY